MKKVAFLILLLTPAVVLQVVAQSAEFQAFAAGVQQYLPLYLVGLMLFKAVSVVYPPLPGVAFTLASVPLIGWPLAYTVDIVGSMLGATVAFFLGKKYGHSLLTRILGRTLADKIDNTRLKEKNQIEASVVMRFAAGGMLSDGLAWGASLIGFKYISFIIGYAISHVISTMPIFYFVGASISFDSWVIVALVAVLAWLIIYKFKGRYFEST